MSNVENLLNEMLYVKIDYKNVRRKRSPLIHHRRNNEIF